VTIAIDPVLTMWEAMNLVARAQARSHTVEIGQTLAELEQVLFIVLLEVVRSTGTYRIPGAAPTGRAIH
jgi:hypothetical protein